MVLIVADKRMQQIIVHIDSETAEAIINHRTNSFHGKFHTALIVISYPC